MSGLFDDKSDETIDELKKIERLYGGIKLPDLTYKDLAPDQFTSESAQYDLAEEDPMMRSRQMDVLARMAGLSEKGLSDVDEAGFNRARSEGNQMARAGTEAAMANAQARGVGGSGLEFAMREAASQGGAQRAQEAGLNQAAESARQRAMYQQAYGQQLAGVRGQDAQAAQANTDIINRFNQANTNQRNQTGQMNTQLKNSTEQQNNEGRRGVAQQNFDNQITRAGGQAQAGIGMANARAAQGAANQSQFNQLVGTGATLGAAYMTGGTSLAAQAAQKKGVA